MKVVAGMAHTIFLCSTRTIPRSLTDNYRLFLHALSDHWSPSRTVDHAFDMTAIRKHSTPLAVAKNLLCISVMLQQLPPHFDQTRLHIGNTATRMDKIMSNVQTLITADDELVSSMEGLDCLVLQGVHHMNNGNPRRAWLTFRRALNVCQLIGIHKTSNKLPGGRGLWQQIIQADRYLVSKVLVLEHIA